MDQTLQVLQDVFRRESRSVLQYVGDAFPWTTDDRTEALDRLRQIVDEEREAIARLSQFLYRRRAPSLASGSYPASFTTLNFVSLDVILRRLIAYQEQSVAGLRAALPAVKDAEARRLLEDYLSLKGRHLEALRQLEASPREPAVTQ